MGSLSGLLQRPFAAAVAVLAAAVSIDVPDKLHTKSAPVHTANTSLPSVVREPSECSTSSSWFAYVSVSNAGRLSAMKRFSVLSEPSSINGKLLCNHVVALPFLHGLLNPSALSFAQNSGNGLANSFLQKALLRPFSYPHGACNKYSPPSSSSSVLLFFTLYESANLSYGIQNSFSPHPNPRFSSAPYPFKHSDLSAQSRYFHKWHLPKEEAYGSGDSMRGQFEHKKPVIAVVLLGWLGAQQKHLKRYADWYTSRGIHAVTFTVPMKEIGSYKPGGKADQNLDLLVTQLGHWMSEDGEDSTEKYLIFHTFSNTGWLTYGVLLEKFLAQDQTLVGKIKGCVVDSAPVATPDPQVWASGFSAALLKKQSVAAKGLLKGKEGNAEITQFEDKPRPAVAETALLVMLENFFKVFLKLPNVDRRLSDVLRLLSNEQPKCPQLYIYSSADVVIPAGSVEAFIEKQKKAGHTVRACNFELSPHVDHFRNFPDLYSAQLSSFLEDCLSH